MTEIIDNIVRSGDDTDEGGQTSQGQDHAYNCMNSPDVVTAYVTGFVGRN